MKRALSYIFSLLISVLLVFMIIASMGSIVFRKTINEDKFCILAAKNNAGQVVYSQLEKYYNDRRSATGIPSEVYTDALDAQFLSGIINDNINAGFAALRCEQYSSETDFSKVDESIDAFFSEYAESISYKKDERYEKKLAETKESAHNVITEYCDIYKFGAMNRHGVIAKLAKLFNYVNIAVVAAAAAALILTLLLLFANSSEKPNALYWIGISGVIAGLISVAPCIYLLADDYFSAFTIKQPQIYTAYTSAMTAFTNTFLSAAICVAAGGIGLLIVYTIIFRKDKKVKPTQV